MLNYNDIDTLFNENSIDIVIHLAGLKSVGESISNPMNYYNNNLKNYGSNSKNIKETLSYILNRDK